MTNRLLHIFFDVDMRGRQNAMIAHAKKHKKFSMDSFKQGDMLVFLNTKRNKIYVLAGLDEEDSYGVLAYYKSPHDRMIDPEAIQFIPEAFSGGSINMNSALRRTLIERFQAKKRLKVERVKLKGAKATQVGSNLSLQ